MRDQWRGEIEAVLSGERRWCVITGDCLDVLPLLPSGCVNAVVTDPPYGQSNEKYDKGVDPRVWVECFRVCTPNAALVSFAGSPTYHRIASAIEAAGWRVRQMWAWVYRDGMIASAYPKEGFDRLAPAMDPICYATKGKVLLSVEREGEGRWSRGERGCFLSERSGGEPAPNGIGHWPRSLVADEDANGFEYFALSRTGASDEKVNHPNQKPLALMSWLVNKLPIGSLVIDSYTGSGSTLVACLKAGLVCVGVEQNEKYAAIARRRCEQAEREQREMLFPAIDAPVQQTIEDLLPD